MAWACYLRRGTRRDMSLSRTDSDRAPRSYSSRHTFRGSSLYSSATEGLQSFACVHQLPRKWQIRRPVQPERAARYMTFAPSSGQTQLAEQQRHAVEPRLVSGQVFLSQPGFRVSVTHVSEAACNGRVPYTTRTPRTLSAACTRGTRVSLRVCAISLEPAHPTRQPAMPFLHQCAALVAPFEVDAHGAATPRFARRVAAPRAAFS